MPCWSSSNRHKKKVLLMGRCNAKCFENINNSFCSSEILCFCFEHHNNNECVTSNRRNETKTQQKILRVWISKTFFNFRLQKKKVRINQQNSKNQDWLRASIELWSNARKISFITLGEHNRKKISKKKHKKEKPFS